MVTAPSYVGAAVDPAAVFLACETLTHSLEGRPIRLLTISSFSGLRLHDEPTVAVAATADGWQLPLVGPRLRRWTGGKRAVLVTGRVHAGETPGSFAWDGFVEFVTRPADPRAQALRERCVFYCIPTLNPDGVARGHWRLDTRGANLNRSYAAPRHDTEPAVAAAMVSALTRQ
jgi:cytosolic carboxypeptidase protein 5